VTDDAERSEPAAEDAEPAVHDASPTGEGGDAADPTRPTAPAGRLPGALGRYVAAFALLLASLVTLGLGTLSLVGRGVDISPTGLFWTSIVLSVVAGALAVTAVIARPG
jgi:hypothetical protein